MGEFWLSEPRSLAFFVFKSTRFQVQQVANDTQPATDVTVSYFNHTEENLDRTGDSVSGKQKSPRITKLEVL